MKDWSSIWKLYHFYNPYRKEWKITFTTFAEMGNVANAVTAVPIFYQ